MIETELVFLKLIIELKFDSTLLFPDRERVHRFIKELTVFMPKYTYNLNNNGEVALKSNDERDSIKLYNNRIIGETSLKDDSPLINNITEIIKLYCSTFEVDKLSRVGVRYNYGAKLPTFELAQTVFSNNVFNISFDNNAAVFGTIDSKKAEFRFKSNDLLYTIYLSPAKFRTLEIIDTDAKQIDFSGFLFDVDVYKKDKVSIDDGLKLINDSGDFVLGRLDAFLHLMEGENAQST